jgi:hypothetical protein
VVALKILRANGAFDRPLTESSLEMAGSDDFQIAVDLFDRLSRELPASLRDSLPAPVQEPFAKAVELLCGDERFACLWQDVGTLGFVYQIWGHTFRNIALDAVQAPNKGLSNQTLISFTQVYTPPWVISYLLDKTLVPLIEGEDNPNRNGDRNKKRDPRTIRLLDPACGAGHFLLAAFDLLKKAYADIGIEAKDSIAIILQNNLYGADIDRLGLTVCALSLLLKVRIDSPAEIERPVNLAWTERNPIDGSLLALGSIDEIWLKENNHFLSAAFDVVITNPPYIGRRLLSRALKEALGKEFPLSKSDLNTAFIDGSLKFLKECGYFGAITQASLLSLPTYQEFRKQLENETDVVAAEHCGTGVFPLLTGEKADSLLLVLRKNTQTKGLRQPFALNRAERLAFVLDHSAAIKLAQLADIRQGLATTDNKRFVRYQWDVDQDAIGKDWVPYLKGAGSERWAAAHDHVVRWKNDGEEIKRAVAEAYPYLQGKTAWVVKNEQFYFKEGLCFSFINKTRLAVRELPPGSIFDVASSAIFTKPDQKDFLFGFLNSSIASAFANSINPTINLQVGDLKRIPVPPLSVEAKGRIAALSRQCVRRKYQLLELFDPVSATVGLNQEGHLSTKFSEMTRLFESVSVALKDCELELDDFVFSETAKAFTFDPKLANELASSADLPKPRTDQLRTSLAARYIHSLCGALLTNEGIEFPQIIDEGFFARRNGDGINPLLKGELDSLELALGMTLQKYFDKHKVLDLARGFRGPSRYISIRLPQSKVTLVLSAKALKTFSLTEEISQQSFRINRNGHASSAGYTQTLAAQESVTILKSVLQGLNKIENWCTQDLISQLDLALAVREHGNA